MYYAFKSDSDLIASDFVQEAKDTMIKGVIAFKSFKTEMKQISHHLIYIYNNRHNKDI